MAKDKQIDAAHEAFFQATGEGTWRAGVDAAIAAYEQAREVPAMPTREAFDNLNGRGVDELLALLAEECGEVVQVIGKSLRHGLTSHHPSDRDTSNRRLLAKELGDVLAVTALLCCEDAACVGAPALLAPQEIALMASSKLDRLPQWLHHANVPPRAVELIERERDVEQLRESLAEYERMPLQAQVNKLTDQNADLRRLLSQRQQPEVPAVPTREEIAHGLSEANRTVLHDDTPFASLPPGECRDSWLAEADYVLSLLAQRQQPPQAVELEEERAYYDKACAHYSRVVAERDAALRDLAEAREQLAAYVAATGCETPELADDQRATSRRVRAELEEKLAAKEAERAERAAFAAAETEHANKWSMRARDAERELADTKARQQRFRNALLSWSDGAQNATLEARRQCGKEVAGMVAGFDDACALTETAEPARNCPAMPTVDELSDEFDCIDVGTRVHTLLKKHVAAALTLAGQELADTKARLERLHDGARLLAMGIGTKSKGDIFGALQALLAETAEPAPQPKSAVSSSDPDDEQDEFKCPAAWLCDTQNKMIVKQDRLITWLRSYHRLYLVSLAGGTYHAGAAKLELHKLDEMLDEAVGKPRAGTAAAHGRADIAEPAPQPVEPAKPQSDECSFCGPNFLGTCSHKPWRRAALPAKPQVTLEALQRQVDGLRRFALCVCDGLGVAADFHEIKQLGFDALAALDTDAAEAGKGEM